MRALPGIMFILLFAALATGGMNASATRQSNPLEAVVQSDWTGQTLSVVLPFPNGAACEAAITRLAVAAHLTVGLERVRDEDFPQQAHAVIRNRRQEILTGKRVSEALGLLLDGAAPLTSSTATTPDLFAWSQSGGVVYITPLGKTRTFLDTVLPDFAFQNDTLGHALARLHKLFDPSFPDPSAIGRGGGILLPGGIDQRQEAELMQAYKAFWEKPLSVSVKNVTVRDVLTRIALAHGDASWLVRYRTVAGEYAGTEIGFFSQIDGATETLAARRLP
jgi:hypothetical protein